jgi:hypothetical protein
MKEEDQDEISQRLQRILAEPVNPADLANEIAKLLTSLGRRVDRREVAQRLAEDLASRFSCKSKVLEALIKYRPKELANLVDLAGWDQTKAEVLPMIAAQKKVPIKVRTDAERLRRNKSAKNRYERWERSYVCKTGAIERDFFITSALVWRYPLLSPSRLCLDEIFRGGSVTMSGRTDSLQWLFGLSRKKLIMAKPVPGRGRKVFYDYQGVVACVDALLKQTVPNVYWLSDPWRRKVVLVNILIRAQQVAKPRINKEFRRILLPHLN